MKPVILVILDGWGYRKESIYNAIVEAKPKHWNAWWDKYPHVLLDASGESVGLPPEQMGNSEVGHLHIGAGRIIDQSLTRIDKAIRNQSLNNHPLLQQILTKHSRIHLIGLLSDGGVHSHEQHFHAMLSIIKSYHNDVFIHAFLDGRDTPPQSAQLYIQRLQDHIQKEKAGIFASMCGRYYAMDRDKRWDRTEKAYAMLTQNKGFHVDNSMMGLHDAYSRGETDEFIQPTIFKEYQPIADNDVVIFMNFRADRARQLTEAFCNPSFASFERGSIPSLKNFLTLTSYSAKNHDNVLFPPPLVNYNLSELIANQGLKQLHIAETEKYAHVTYFFNGGREQPYPLEDRILIPSPQIATYDLKPEMSAYLITDHLVRFIQQQAYDFYVVNYANPDMVGHTGKYQATVHAIETIDQCLLKLYTEANNLGVDIFITADHGNAEMMYDEEKKQPHTAHTRNFVPFLCLNSSMKALASYGKLIDVAPTILHCMGLAIPKIMTGKPLMSKVSYA